MSGLLIGELARRAAVTPATIRYYEAIGLLMAPVRSPKGYRRYSSGSVEEVAFIRQAQGLGFSLAEIGEILRLTRSGEPPCSEVLEIARRHLQRLSERITRLERFRDSFARELAKWDGVREPTCQGLCQIIVRTATAIGAQPPEEAVASSLSRNRRD